MANIYIDNRWPPHTGIGNVMSELRLRAPSNHLLIDLGVGSKIGSPFSPIAVSRALFETSACGDEAIFWNPGFIPPILNFRFKSIVTVHDLTHLHFYSSVHRLYYNLIFKSLYKRCDAIVCVSDYTRNEFIEWSGIDGGKVFVVHNGVSSGFISNKDKFDPGFSYILYPGNHREYKNIKRLLLAYSLSELPKRGVRFLLTGSPNASLLTLAREHGVEGMVQFLGRLDSEDLPKLYKGALFIVFISLYEGFGLPIVEAMASGVPVITSNVSAMPEVAGDAALIVNPYSIDEIIYSLNAFFSDAELRRLFVNKGLERVKQFDWNASAEKFWGIVNNIYR